MKKMKSNVKFLTDLIEKFPELKIEILDSDYKGKISLQIGCFRRFTQEAINKNDLILVKKHFDFVDENYDLVNSTTRNFLVVCYLGKLDFTKNGSIERLLSNKLHTEISQLKSYYKLLENDETLNNFFKNL